MVRHVIRVAENGAQAQIAGQARSELSHALAGLRPVCGARPGGDTRTGGRTYALPGGSLGGGTSTAEPVTRQWDGVGRHLGGACATDRDAHQAKTGTSSERNPATVPGRP
jgi:hypothetical protein